MKRFSISQKVDTLFVAGTALTLSVAIAIGALIPDSTNEPTQTSSAIPTESTNQPE